MLDFFFERDIIVYRKLPIARIKKLFNSKPFEFLKWICPPFIHETVHDQFFGISS